MATADPMSPEASPGEVSRNNGVRRVNNNPLYIFGGGVGLFLAIVFMVAYDRSTRQPQSDDSDSNKAGNTSMYAKELAGNQTDGMVPASGLSLPISSAQAGSLPSTMPPDLAAPPRQVQYPAPAPAPTTQPDPQDAEQDELASRIAQAKRAQFEQALRAKTAVPIPPVQGSGGGYIDPASPIPPSSGQETAARLAAMRQQSAAQRQNDPAQAYQARVAQLQSLGVGGAGAAGVAAALAGQSSSNSRNDYSQFGNQDQLDRWRLNSAPEAPRTPYEMRAGFVIPATLISGINSELPGQIVAQVSQNVYDTATGKWLLVPQGTRLVGAYNSNIVFGQSRVLVAWQRLVFPDGKAMDIGSMPGADGSGYAGMTDQVNNHYVRIFGSALLMSGVIAGVAYSQNRNTQANGTYAAPTAGATISQSLGQELGQVTSQMISKNLSVAPTLEIRPGYRFNVVAVKDLTFSKPYKAFDY